MSTKNSPTKVNQSSEVVSQLYAKIQSDFIFYLEMSVGFFFALLLILLSRKQITVLFFKDKTGDKRLSTNIEDYRIDVRTANPPELSNKEPLNKKDFIRYLQSTWN